MKNTNEIQKPTNSKVYKPLSTKKTMKETKVSFEFIVENCKTIEDVRKLDAEIREYNSSIDEVKEKLKNLLVDRELLIKKWTNK